MSVFLNLLRDDDGYSDSGLQNDGIINDIIGIDTILSAFVLFSYLKTQLSPGPLTPAADRVSLA